MFTRNAFVCRSLSADAVQLKELVGGATEWLLGVVHSAVYCMGIWWLLLVCVHDPKVIMPFGIRWWQKMEASVFSHHF